MEFRLHIPIEMREWTGVLFEKLDAFSAKKYRVPSQSMIVLAGVYKHTEPELIKMLNQSRIPFESIHFKRNMKVQVLTEEYQNVTGIILNFSNAAADVMISHPSSRGISIQTFKLRNLHPVLAPRSYTNVLQEGVNKRWLGDWVPVPEVARS
jgi:hypothetical protein